MTHLIKETELSCKLKTEVKATYITERRSTEYFRVIYIFISAASSSG